MVRVAIQAAHILFLDGVYVYRDNRPPRFQRVRAPDKSELEDLVHLISQRAGRCLVRQGLLEQDTESVWLELEPADDADDMPDQTGQALQQILGSSFSYRIASEPHYVLMPYRTPGTAYERS